MPDALARLHLQIAGAVQGVGFRPFVYRLARACQLGGTVRNESGGVSIEVEGPAPVLHIFRERLESEAPPHALIFGIEPRWLEPKGYEDFSIAESIAETGASPIILPDLATCSDCVAEIFDSKARRYYYPFANCTRCGPRYTIIQSLPYDRERTSMLGFPLCSDCRGEYGNPDDRRFHAQPIACPACGPALFLHDASGTLLARSTEAPEVRDMLQRAALCLQEGGIVAIMGLGGAQLLADATQEGAVALLRRRKARDAKPFAVMIPGPGALRSIALATKAEEALLRSAAAPIVLLKRRDPSPLARNIAEFSPNVGVMLPSTPLHHLLMHAVGSPVVCTSGNLSGEPLCTTPRETLTRLHGVADLFLLHNRPILRPLDDSVVRIFQNREIVVRRARGYAPLPLRRQTGPDALAMGADLKNAPAWRAAERLVPGEHLGDMEAEATLRSLRRQSADMTALLGAKPAHIVVDAHPDSMAAREGRRLAEEWKIPAVAVQHHVAHVMGCVAENEVTLPAMGLAWDGAGYGEDGTVWGGEFFRIEESSCIRAGHIRAFRLPGGDAAAREPARCAVALLAACSPGEYAHLSSCVREALQPSTRTALEQLAGGQLAPAATSMGRVFDAVAFFLGFDGPQRCEAQAAMYLENLGSRFCPGKTPPPPLAWELSELAGTLVADWEPALGELDAALRAGTPADELAWRFHDGLAAMAAGAATQLGAERVAVGGGCFANRLLLERLIQRGQQAGLSIYFPQRIPCHDGGLAAGQLEAARRSFFFHPIIHS